MLDSSDFKHMKQYSTLSDPQRCTVSGFHSSVASQRSSRLASQIMLTDMGCGHKSKSTVEQYPQWTQTAKDICAINSSSSRGVARIFGKRGQTIKTSESRGENPYTGSHAH